MIRKINVIHYKHKESIQGFTDIQISELSSLVNYSIDVMYCSVLNKVEKDKTNYYLDILADKVRHMGQLILVISNIRNLCAAYVNKSIEDKVFFETMKDVSEALTEEQIINYMLGKHNFDIIGMEKNHTMTAITFQRKKND